ncbi:MAG: efflux RND transporter periplasmic adaptor subunit [Planctomycetes bacterium]|nr:efflux RND transporter periplasmic adaptor subunit [Planctomycetota bacterium]MCH9724004.1 efflux RND transporter periplasmic adaptor subunit [Planctomycetota bacterium]MCH9778060.1 efflux RND transporter periplasmic adaptor subunit [Planctomycetota bacterium]
MKSRVAFVLLIVVSVMGFALFWDQIRHTYEQDQVTKPGASDTAKESGLSSSDVLLSEEKIKAMHLTLSPVKRQNLNRVRIVPGRLRYDDRKHVDIKAPTEGVLIETRVKPGDSVKTGQILAVINSPEIGTARADLLQRTTEYQLVRNQYDWKALIQNNVQKLVDALLSQRSMESVEKEFSNAKLGSFRSDLLPAYSRYLLAVMVNQKSVPLAKSGAISQQTKQMREAEVQESRANLKALCEQSIYDVRLERDQVLAKLNDANHRMKISQQHLESLIGSSKDLNTEELKSAEKLSRLEIIAPFSGTIEERTFSQTERVKQSDSLFVLSQTDSLWVAADIRESDWSAISLNSGQDLKVKIIAFPNQTFSARLYYLGRKVSPRTNSVPLIAEIKNPKGLLRPGMFAQVMIPGEEKSDVIAVPTRAVLDDAAQKFVFIKASDRSFRRVDIQSGFKTEDWVEVQNGLYGGEQVVEEGAFTLKSELLLEREE